MPAALATAALGAGGIASGGLLTIASMIGSGLLSGLFGLGDSPSEESIKKFVDKLYDELDWLKTSPFSKEELFNAILPSVQATYRRAADVAAGKIGATLPETTGNVPKGQPLMDYYIQSLSPVIAEGEFKAGQATTDFTKLWADMDANTKQLFLQAINVGTQASQGLPNMNPMQKFFTNFLSGAKIGGDIAGSFALGDAINEQAGGITDILKMVEGVNKGDTASSTDNIAQLYKTIINKQIKSGTSFPQMKDFMLSPEGI